MSRTSIEVNKKKGRWEGGFTMRIVGLLADLAIYLDHTIGVIADRIFAMFPSQIQEKFRELNATFVIHRNRYLGITPVSKESKESEAVKQEATKNYESFCDCNTLELDARKLNNLEIDTGTPGYQGTFTTERDTFQIDSKKKADDELALQRGDVPGWVLVVLMTTGLVTALWTIAAPRLSQILRNSLDSMNSIR